ncbi:putative ribosomal protein S15 [Helianthus annuus]|nr:putative ribosomal protein S15 [Helianthus annuus]
MVRNSFISIILKEQEENKENRGSVEFQVVSFTNKIRRLTSHLELHKKDYFSQRGLRGWLICKKNRVRYKELIGQLDIRERKTR